MSATHTPGPWKSDGMLILARFDSSSGPFPVAQTAGFRGVEVDCANARLIAAAPELLAACWEALKWCGDNHPAVELPIEAALKAAIEKAEGP